MTPGLAPISGAALRSPLLLYTRAEINGHDIDIFPDDPNQPGGRLVIPNRSGGSGFGNWRYSPRNWFNHSYLVVTFGPDTLEGRENLALVGDALRRRPTPGKPQPATVEGTLNDVGPLVGPDRTWLEDLAEWYSPNNFVFSYALPAPIPGSVSAMVLNYTQHGHHMIDEGFVLRYAKMSAVGTISLVSYGEGNSFRQSWATSTLSGWKETVRQVWDRNQQLIFAEAAGGRRQPT